MREIRRPRLESEVSWAPFLISFGEGKVLSRVRDQSVAVGPTHATMMHVSPLLELQTS